MTGAACVPRLCWSACVVGCTLCSVCPAVVTERAFEPGAGACPDGALAEGAACDPLVEEDGGALCCGGLLADGAGVTGELTVEPGCCANAVDAKPKRQMSASVERAFEIILLPRIFITLNYLVSIACGRGLHYYFVIKLNNEAVAVAVLRRAQANVPVTPEPMRPQMRLRPRSSKSE